MKDLHRKLLQNDGHIRFRNELFDDDATVDVRMDVIRCDAESAKQGCRPKSREKIDTNESQIYKKLNCAFDF